MSDAARRPVLLPVLRRGRPPPPRGHARRLALPLLHPRLHPQARRTGDVMSADTLISPMPTYGPASNLPEHREALARRAAWRLEDASPQTIIRWAVRTFGSRFAVTSSMADAVLIDLVATAAPGTDVVFLDTGYHFEQTLTMRDAVAATYRGRINLDHDQRPSRRWPSRTPSTGRDLFGSNPDRCCFLRKVLPLDRALAGYDAWGSGLRRDDSIARSRTQVVDWDRRNGMVKVNPLARWTQADVDAYIERHDILTNPLLVGRLRLGRLLPVHPADRRRRGRPGRPLGRQRQERVRHPRRGAGVSAPIVPARPRPRRPARGRRRRRPGGRPADGGAGRGRGRRGAGRRRGSARTCATSWTPGAVTWLAAGLRRRRPRRCLAGAHGHRRPGHRRPGRRARRGRPGVVRACRRRVAVGGLDPRGRPRRRRDRRGDRRRRPAPRDDPARRGGPGPGHRRPAAAPPPAGADRAASRWSAAGPGDPGLITTRGRRLLAEADVVLVDRLAPRALLDDLDPDGARRRRGQDGRAPSAAAGGDQPAPGGARPGRAPGRPAQGRRPVRARAAAARRRSPAWRPACRSRSCPGSPARSRCRPRRASRSPTGAGPPGDHRLRSRGPRLGVAGGARGHPRAAHGGQRRSTMAASRAGAHGREAGRHPAADRRVGLLAAAADHGRHPRHASPRWPGSATCRPRRSSSSATSSDLHASWDEARAAAGRGRARQPRPGAASAARTLLAAGTPANAPGLDVQVVLPRPRRSPRLADVVAAVGDGPASSYRCCSARPTTAAMDIPAALAAATPAPPGRRPRAGPSAARRRSSGGWRRWAWTRATRAPPSCWRRPGRPTPRPWTTSGSWPPLGGARGWWARRWRRSRRRPDRRVEEAVGRLRAAGAPRVAVASLPARSPACSPTGRGSRRRRHVGAAGRRPRGRRRWCSGATTRTSSGSSYGLRHGDQVDLLVHRPRRLARARCRGPSRRSSWRSRPAPAGSTRAARAPSTLPYGSRMVPCRRATIQAWSSAWPRRSS